MPASHLSADASSELLSQLRARIRASGLLERRPGRYARRALLLSPLLAVSLGLAWTHSWFSVVIASSFVAAGLCIQLGLMAHDASHGAVARGRASNACVGHAAFTLVNGLGFESWCVSHAAHHVGCQDESADPDMWIDTLLSLTPGSAEAKSGLGKRLLPYQGFTLWCMAPFFAHSLRLQSLGRSYREPVRYRRDVLLLPLHYGLWFALPIVHSGVGWGRALTVYALVSAAMGLYLAVLFWVNHIGMPVVEAGSRLSYVEQQVVGSRNVHCPAGIDWFFGGMNFQIEHHLVPDCPGPRLREVRDIARPLCVEAGLPYREEGFREALASVTQHVRNIAHQSRLNVRGSRGGVTARAFHK
jgi:fatty acid desaturase